MRDFMVRKTTKTTDSKGLMIRPTLVIEFTIGGESFDLSLEDAAMVAERISRWTKPNDDDPSPRETFSMVTLSELGAPDHGPRSPL